MKAILVEDSRLARLELREQLKDFDEIDLIGEASNVPEALAKIKELKPDLLLLDIHMPKQTGFDLLEQLDYLPLVIFTTAYSEHAIKSFEYEAVDYLLKPIVNKRLSQAINKASQRYKLLNPDTLENSSQFFVKDGNKAWFIKLDDVFAFENIGNYTRIHLQEAKPLIYKSLSQLEERLPKANFFRANRNQIINTECIESIDTNVGGSIEFTLNNGLKIEASRRQTSLFKKLWSL